MSDHTAPWSGQNEEPREARGKRTAATGWGKRLAAFPSKALQLLGLLIAFMLLLAANGFSATHPGLSAGLVFAFSLPYLLAAVASRRAHYLYATMLLGAAAYFLACHALGAPGTSFPLLSVPLVLALWLVAQQLRRRLAERYADFPQTVLRAMDITVAVFTVWALVQAPHQMALSGLPAAIAWLAFLGFAAIYLAHALVGASFVYTYVFALFLTVGAALCGLDVLGFRFCWAFTVAAAGVVLLTGTQFHRARGYRWSHHFYFAGGAALVLGLTLALASISYYLYGLAFAMLVLLLAYRRLAEAVGEVRSATTVERGLARFLFYGALSMGAPAALVVLLLPGNRLVSMPALALGLLWAWVAGQRRRMVVAGRNPYVLPAAFFISAGLLGAGAMLPAAVADGWALGIGLALLVGLGALYAHFGRTDQAPLARSAAEAAVFPAFFAFYLPLMGGHSAAALACAGAALAAVLVLAAALRCGLFFYAAGPAVAGAVVAAAMQWPGGTAWAACAVAAALAGALFVWATAPQRSVTRGAAALAWLVLSAATVAVAYTTGETAQVMLSTVAVAAIAVLVAGETTRRGVKDVFALAVSAVGPSATAVAIALGPASGMGPTNVGLCVLALALAHWLAWGRGLSVWHARAAQVVMALGLLLVIFGQFGGLSARMLAGAGVTALFFIIGSLARLRFPRVADSAVAVAHLTSLVLAVTALIGAWSGASRDVALSVLPFVVIYALMPGLRARTGLRLGAALWVSVLALLGLSAIAGTPYALQTPLIALLGLVWVAAGYWLKRRGSADGALALLIAGGVVAVSCGAVTLFTHGSANMPADAWRVFLVDGIAFAALFLILRQDVFAYLLTFSLALMAYAWVRQSTSVFTQQLLFSLVVGCGVLGVFFLLPHAKRLLMRAASVPMFGVFTWRGAAVMAVPVLGAGALVLSAYGLQITQHPKFCIACHYMDNYYQSWQHSSHKDVACVECHYAPGVQAEVKGKIGGLVQVVKYITHSYGGKPQADISNASCMRQGCHANIASDKEILLFAGKIRFRHDKHLTGLPRGKKLNCTSCHGQVVQGTHISVTETTCLTCHFYGRGSKPTAVGSCTSCHSVPTKTVTFDSQPFNHKEFLAGKKDVSCQECHSQVTQGDGHVSEARCRICHMSATLPIKDQVKFHRVHVSEQHFDCLQCHAEIQHGKHSMAQQLLTTTQCNSCHDMQLHTVQERVYAGQAVMGVPSTPDAMYQAGVSCTGCHTETQLAVADQPTSATKVSGSKQCSECHNNAGFGKMLTLWQQNTVSRLAELQAALKDLQGKQPDAKASPQKVAQWHKLLGSAKMKLDIVVADGSKGAHNFAYVSSILDGAESELNQCRSMLAELKKKANPEVALN